MSKLKIKSEFLPLAWLGGHILVQLCNIELVQYIVYSVYRGAVSSEAASVRPGSASDVGLVSHRLFREWDSEFILNQTYS